MESSSSELSKEETKVSSIGMVEDTEVEKNCLGNGKIPIIQSTSIDSSGKGTENGTNFKIPIERDRGEIMVHDSRNDGSNSPTYSYPYSVHTCSRGNGNVPPNGQVVKLGDKAESSRIINELECYSVHTSQRDDNTNRNLTETSDPNCDAGPNGQAVVLWEKAERDNMSLTNEPECGATLDLENFNKSIPVETELVLHSSVKTNQPGLNLFSDFDSSSSSNESNKIRSLILKKWGDSPSKNVWYNLKPCLVVLQRCDTNENSVLAKSFSCNTSTEQSLDTISVISDSEDEPVNHSGSKLYFGKLRSRKSHSDSSQCSEKKKSSFRSKCLQATIKGTSKMRKNNSKVFEKMSDLSKDSDLDNDGPNDNKFSNTKKTIKVSVQVHKPPESDDDSDPITFNKTSENCQKNKGITVEMHSNASSPIDQKNGKRKRNSSSISSMSFSELISDSEYVGSKRRIIKPSTSLQPSSQIHKEINQETVGSISDLDNSDHLHTCFKSSEISENLLTPTVEMPSNASTPIDQEKNGQRKRNSSSISSMSFSELISDSEYVNSKGRIIKPSRRPQHSLHIHKEINQETVDSISDLDVSDNLQNSEISEKLLTGNGDVEIYPTQNSLSAWTYQPDIDISRLTFKPCHVILNRCDDQIEIYSSKVTDVNSINQPISRSSDSNFSFSVPQNSKRNPNRIGSDSFHSELSDTDEVTRPPTKKISPKLKKKRGWTKKKLLGLHKRFAAKPPAGQKIINKSVIMKEILELKNTMKRAEEKIDKLIKLHLQIIDSD